jgi:hypothetical protein
MTLKIECANQTVLEHLMYFLKALPKNDVKVELCNDDVFTLENKKNYERAIENLQSGNSVTSKEASHLLGV